MEPVDASGPNHKHRNSWRITTKKQELFFFPSLSLRPPQSFLPRNKRIKVKILLIEVWLSLPHPVTGDLRGRVGHFGVQMWILLFVCLRQRLPRGRGVDGGAGGTMRNLCFSSVCLRLALEMKVSGGEGVGAGARIFSGASHRAVEGPVWPYYGRARWAGRSQSPRGAAETGMMPIRMEQANICLAQKNPD